MVELVLIVWISYLCTQILLTNNVSKSDIKTNFEIPTLGSVGCEIENIIDQDDHHLCNTTNNKHTKSFFSVEKKEAICYVCEVHLTGEGSRIKSWLDPYCGGEYNTSFGIIDYWNYTNDACCTWKIEASAPIDITFIRFSLEKYFDYLFVYGKNYSHSAWTWIDTLTGHSLPSPIHTHSNIVLLQFASDSSIVDTGFELYWQS
ncbi:unnamed protein product, partial [Meganyctiphanes norvegica]